jgi:hypothetical protein
LLQSREEATVPQPAGSVRQAQDIDQVLAMLAEIVAGARAANSASGYFPALYRQVTLRVKQGIARGFFDDGPRMERLDTVFANRFFAAFDTFRAGGEPSHCWQVAFRATRRDQAIILQDLLLGINAHINFDLGVATAEIGDRGDALAALRGDFEKVNQILAELLPKAEAVIGRFSPMIGLLDQLGGRDETAVLNFSIDAARDDAWNHALILANLPASLWPQALAALDSKAAFLGRLIAEPGGLAGKAVEMIRLTESIDRAAIVEALDSLDQAPAAPALSSAPAASASSGPAGAGG